MSAGSLLLFLLDDTNREKTSVIVAQSFLKTLYLFSVHFTCSISIWSLSRKKILVSYIFFSNLDWNKLNGNQKC